MFLLSLRQSRVHNKQTYPPRRLAALRPMSYHKGTMRLIRVLPLLAFTAAFLFLASSAHAENVQWNQNLTGDYTSPSLNCCGPATVDLIMSLSNPGITVNYYGQAFQIDSSGNKLRQLSSGDSMNAGDRVLFEFTS